MFMAGVVTCSVQASADVRNTVVVEIEAESVTVKMLVTVL